MAKRVAVPRSGSQSRGSASRVRAVKSQSAPPDTGDLDGLIHGRFRLGIMSALGANDTLSFNELKVLLKTSDGNVSAHARKLEEADYITCFKSFEGRVPKTEFRITQRGRRALEKYLNHMEALIRATRES